MRTSSLLALVAVLGTAAVAEAKKQVHYVGVHPLALEGGAFCYIEGPHIHMVEPPQAEVLFRVEPDGYHFVGDPVPYGYDGPKHAYYGGHPIDVDVVIPYDDRDDEDEYCYLEGPHYHSYTPAGGKFTLKGGVNYYVGDLPEVYVTQKPKYTRINTVYKPLRYSRPVVVVAPPAEYHGHVVEVYEPVGVVETHPGVVGVGIEVHAPVLEVRLPGVVVEEHHHVVVPVKHKRGHGHGHGRKRKW
jgi:hypothetical protein